MLTRTINLEENASAVLARVQSFIDMNIYNSAVWDGLEEKQKLKAIFNAHRLLVTLLPSIYSNNSPATVDLDDLVAEIMWLIKKDDSTDRADQGATGVSIDGMSIYFDTKKTGSQIAPEIISRYGLTNLGRKRKVGRYSLPRQDTARTGFYLGDKERFR